MCSTSSNLALYFAPRRIYVDIACKWNLTVENNVGNLRWKYIHNGHYVDEIAGRFVCLKRLLIVAFVASKPNSELSVEPVKEPFSKRVICLCRLL